MATPTETTRLASSGINASTSLSADPTISERLHMLTQMGGTLGLGLGIYGLENGNLRFMTAATLLTVVGSGFLSFLRHSIFFRSDEARIGWNAGRDPEFVNFFLIEVGFANAAFGLLGLLAVVCNWGLALQAASFLVYGFYIGQVAVMLLHLQLTHHPGGRGWKSFVSSAVFASLLLYVGIRGMILANDGSMEDDY